MMEWIEEQQERWFDPFTAPVELRCINVYVCISVFVRSLVVMLFLVQKLCGIPVCRTSNLFALGISRGNSCFTNSMDIFPLFL